MKSIIYKIFLLTYRVLPFKKQICLILKGLNIPNDKFYSDLKFGGSFEVNVDSVNKFKMIHFGGTIANRTFWKGLFTNFEPDTGWCWKEFCNFSDVIFDVGANVGIYSLVAKSINPKSKVYSFEPSINTIHKLQKNNSINKYDININQLAVSNLEGKLTFYDVPDEHQTSASLSFDKLKNLSWYKGEIKEYEVDVISIKKFIEKNDIKKIDLIKIDVEMHEPEIIEGIGHYLEKFKPIIFIEVLSDTIAQRLNGLITSKGYYIYHLYANGVVKRQDKFTVHPNLWNYVVFHKDKKAYIDSQTKIFQF